jgi:hypothetical protein
VELGDSFRARSRKETTKATTPRGQRTRFRMTPYRCGAIACVVLSADAVDCRCQQKQLKVAPALSRTSRACR